MEAEGAGKSKGWYSRGYLPHCDESQRTQFITFHLADSLPKDVLDRWREELKFLPRTQRENERRSRIMRYLDSGCGECWLKQHEVAKLVEDSLLHFDGDRYHLCAWVVMPNHVHALIQLRDDWSLPVILHSWKSFSSRQANLLLSRTGEFWYREFYDRYIRDEEHFCRVGGYIQFNPVMADLCTASEHWRWSSASRRVDS